VVQRKPKTDKERFMAKSFALKAFVPSTGLGNFDVEYKPKSGAMRVIMNLHFDFTDVDTAWKSQATDPADTKWKSAQKKQWVNEFKTQILSVWGNINQIKCVKAGWEDVVASPKLEIKEVSKSKANFSVTVDKAFTTAAGKMRTSQGSTSVGGEDREKKAAFQEQDNKDKINDARVKTHLANTERSLNITPAFTRDQERLAKVLAQFLGVVFRPGTADLSASMITTLKSAAAKILALRKDSALARLHPIKVKLGLKGTETAALAGRRFSAIQALLTGEGVENPLVSESAASANPRATFAPGDAAGVSDAYFANWKRLTVAHEFGHMMGLLDEYCPAVSPDLLQMMEDEGAIPDAGAPMSGTAQGRVAQDKDKQDAYAKMLTANNLKTPTWARPTTDSQEKSTSLMSGGFEILTQHYVTIWEALAKATEAHLTQGDWKL
jgi:hypothetical protein